MTGGLQPRDPEFGDVARLIEDSRAWRFVAGGVRIGAAAVADSRIAAVVRRRWQEFGALPSAERAGALTVLLTTAAVAHLVLLPLVPARSAPAEPPTAWTLVALAALVTMIGIRHAMNATTKTRRREGDG